MARLSKVADATTEYVDALEEILKLRESGSEEEALQRHRELQVLAKSIDRVVRRLPVGEDGITALGKISLTRSLRALTMAAKALKYDSVENARDRVRDAEISLQSSLARIMEKEPA